MKARLLPALLSVPVAAVAFVACAASESRKTAEPAPVATASIGPVSTRIAVATTPKPDPVPTPRAEPDAGAEAAEPPIVMPDPVVSDAGTKLAGNLRLSAPCVKPAVHAAVELAVDGGGAPMLDFFVEDATVTLDLDRDGKKDVVLNGGAARWEITYWLYVRRGGCGHFVGIVPSSAPLKALPSSAHGLGDLRAVSDQCTSSASGWCEIVYRFDGTHYAPSTERPTARPPSAMP